MLFGIAAVLYLAIRMEITFISTVGTIIGKVAVWNGIPVFYAQKAQDKSNTMNIMVENIFLWFYARQQGARAKTPF